MINLQSLMNLLKQKDDFIQTLKFDVERSKLGNSVSNKSVLMRNDINITQQENDSRFGRITTESNIGQNVNLISPLNAKRNDNKIGFNLKRFSELKSNSKLNLSPTPKK